MAQDDQFLEKHRVGNEERRTKENAELRAVIDNLERVLADSREKLQYEENPSLKQLVEAAERSLEDLKQKLRKQNDDPAVEAFNRR